MQLRVEGLSKRFGDATVVAIPALTVEAGELFVVAGPAASGKTTLLRLLSGLDRPTEGTVALDGAVVGSDPTGPGVRYGSLETPLEATGDTVWVLDEPLTGLAADARRAARDAFKQRHTGSGATVVYAAEDQAEALALADRIAVLRDGRLQQLGPPSAILDRPATTFVASYFGTPPMNVVPGILEKDGVAVEIGPRSIQLSGAVAQTYARDVFLAIRPEHVRLATDRPSGWRGTVSAVDRLEDGVTVTVAVDMGTFVAHERGDASYRVGQSVTLMLPPRHLHVFDERGGRLDVR